MGRDHGRDRQEPDLAPDGDRPRPLRRERKNDKEMVRRFLRDIAAVNIHRDELRQSWARILGISGPQWMILMALCGGSLFSERPLDDDDQNERST
jgi:hypothetical protein